MAVSGTLVFKSKGRHGIGCLSDHFRFSTFRHLFKKQIAKFLAVGIAFMLQQRSQGPMGRKTVDYVNVLGNPFHGDETLNTNLAFHLKDYTPPPA